MEEDDDLTHLLARATDPPVATTDSFRAVMVRYRKGRTRVLLATVVAVALLGPAAGVVVGRATADNSTQVATGASPESTGTGSAVDSRVDASGDSVASLTGSGYGFGLHSATPSKRLFVRTTTDGVTIRAYLQEGLPGPSEPECATSDQGVVPCPALPADCPGPPDAQLQAGLSNDGAVDPGYVPATSADPTEPVTVLHASYFGVTEGDPAVWAAVRTGAGVEGVRVRFADGATDEMTPVDGYAVLAHRTATAPSLPTGPASSPEEWEAAMKAAMPQGSVEALDADGAVISTADLASASPIGPMPMECVIEGGPKPGLHEGESVPPAVPAVPPTSRP